MCGKKGIFYGYFISRKPLLQKIDFKTLGYVCTNGQINFQNEESALKYAKNTIIKALKHGKEREVITKDASVLRVVDGNAESVESKFIDKPDIPGSIQHHGHPNPNGYFAYPFSEQDIKTFMLLNKVLGYKKSVVYNILGEECTMTAKKEPKLYKLKLPSITRLVLYKWNPITWFRHWQIDKTVNKFNKNFSLDNYLNKLSKRCTNEEREFVKTLKATPENLQGWIEDKVNALMQHDVLQELTTKLGIEYKTDFSHIKN